MNKFIFPILLTLIVLFGFYFRFVQLTQVPVGFNWDEASVGYNSYTLMKTGVDEFGKPWPIFIESFGDFKTGLYSILIVPIIKQLGLSIFSVRILNVFVGTSVILAGYFLAVKYFKNRLLALVLAFLFATSPLLIHFSRFTLEWYMVLPLFLVGVGLILPNKNWQVSFPMGAFFLGFSLYWYHSLRLFLPLFLLAYLAIYRKKLLLNKKTLLFGFLIGLVTILPLLSSMKENNILARPTAVAIFGNQDHQRTQIEAIYRYNVTGLPLIRLFTNKGVYYGQEIAYRYLLHFSPDFLFFGKDATPRISIYPIGKLQLVLLPFLLIGFVQLFKSLKDKKHQLLLAWLLLSPLPASLTDDSPHGLRSLIFLPAIYLVVIIGINQVYKVIKKNYSTKVQFGIGLVVVGLFFLNFFWQMGQYFLFYPEETRNYWQADQKAMIAQLVDLQDDFTNIVVTKIDGQPHIFYAFFTKMEPRIYQMEVVDQQEEFNTRINHLGKIKFGIDKDDWCQEDTLVVTKDKLDINDLAPVAITYSPDRFQQPKEAFYFYDTNDELIRKKYCPDEKIIN